MRLVIAGATGTVGQHVVEAARARGHETVTLSRASGQDLVSGAGLAAAMAGAHAVIDVSSTRTTSAAKATAFFTAVTRNLQRAESEAGVGHHVGLSIVGIDELDAGYWRGKLAHEHAIREGAVAWSLLRASQFHEFAEQIVQRASLGPVVAVPKMLMRPVAAREVGARLVDIAEGPPAGRVTDLIGPGDEVLIDMVRRMFAFDGVTRHCVPLALPGRVWRGAASGALRGNRDADRGNIGFNEWLAGPDHRKAH